MLRLFLFISFGIGPGAHGLSAFQFPGLRAVVHARQHVGTADSIRVGHVFPGEAGLYAGRVTRRIRLGEKKHVMSDVASVAFPGNGNFFAVARQVSGLVLYDTTGRQVRAISRWGSRRLEYDRPQIARATGDTVVVWDGGNLKYLYFDGDGEPIGEISGFTWETSDFLVGRDRIVGYRSGDMPREFLYDYDAVTDRITLSGERTGISMARPEVTERSSLAGDPDRYAYIPAGSCRLRLVERGALIEDVDVCGSDARPASVHSLEGLFVVVSTVGLEEVETNLEESHLLLKVLDPGLGSLDSIEIRTETTASRGMSVVGSDGKCLYFIAGNSTGDSGNIQRELIEITLERVDE